MVLNPHLMSYAQNISVRGTLSARHSVPEKSIFPETFLFPVRYRHKRAQKYYFRFFAGSPAHTPPVISAIKAIAAGNGDFRVGTGAGTVVAGSAFKLA